MDPGLSSLTIAGVIESLAQVRDFVEASARGLRIPPKELYRFQLAAEEACTNIIRHGLLGFPPERTAIALEMRSTEAGWTLTIRDQGRAFDPENYPRPDTNGALRKRRPGGLGIHLIRSLADEIRYESDGQVNALTISRWRR